MFKRLHQHNFIFQRAQRGFALASAWLAAAWLLAACSQDSGQPNHLQQVQARGYLTVGTLMNSSGYFLREDGEAGFEFELAQQLANELGVELSVEPRVHIEDLFNDLANGDIDFIAAGLDVTTKRRKSMRFTPYYHQVDQRLVYKQGARSRPRDWQELEGDLVVVAGSSHEEYLYDVERDYPELNWRSTRLYDADELLTKVINEEIAYTIADTNTLDVKRRAFPDLSVAFTVRNDAPLAWAFPQNDDDSLYATAIEFIGRQHDSGEIIKLVDRYWGHVKQFNYVDTQLFIQAVNDTLPDYIELFQQYAGELDWRLLAAVSYQESLWDPWARSPTGVRGMMMLTLPTARSMGVRSRLDAEQSIRGGARYLTRLRERLPARMTEPDRTWFALAAYNVGLGHLNDAREITRRQGGDPDYWVDVRQRLPLLRQKQHYQHTRFGFARGDEPVTYVGNIRRYYDTLRWLDEQGRIPYPEHLMVAEEPATNSVEMRVDEVDE
ncbi:MAG: membrane-bound lytic murein transglycosylase MltF [Firmicutes bacterium]|nr:membrane-bound lytic murein transglycosylase MltF [Bacillota bacterium]